MMNYKKLNFTKLATSIALTVLLVGVGFCFGESANAQEEIEQPSNLRIFYQGQLTDSEGNPIADGKYNMRFRIYDQEEGGNILWQEEYTFYNAISVEGGQFKVILGRENPINLNLDEAPFWLGISIGTVTEGGEIEWEEEIQPRKKITTLSELLGVEELTPEQWANLSQLIQEKLGEETDIVLLFDLTQLESLETEEGTDFSASMISFFQNFIKFISEKISEIGEKINQILAKIDSIISTLTNIVNTLAEMKHKIDIIYQVLIVEEGLEPSDLKCDSTHLNLCLTEVNCLNAGGFWYDGACNVEAKEESVEPTCDAEHLSLCTTQELCEEASLYWHNETCNTEPETPAGEEEEEEEEAPACTPEWSCSDWQPLPETIACGETFTQTRTCTDSNSCGIEERKPIEEQEAIGTNPEACGTTSCDPTLNLVGECQNTCVEGSCESCIPTCSCIDGYQKDDNGVCQLIESPAEE